MDGVINGMVTFLPQFMMGSQGMPRRYATYLPEWQGYHQVSTVGAFILGTGFALMIGYLVHSLFAGKPARENYWGGATLDWKTATPPIHTNFEEDPVVTSDEIYDYSFLSEEKGKA